jgi:hypothetical protein
MSPSRSTAPSSQALARRFVPLALACLAWPAFAQTPATALPPGDKTPQQSTLGPAVSLSPAQLAAVAAKRIAVMPAPDAPTATVTEKAAGSSASAPLAPDPPSNGRPISAAELTAAARAAQAQAAASLVPARPIRASAAWTTSPALGEIPRLDWRLPLPKKPADMIWIASPSGGRQIPVMPESSGGER